MKVGLFIPCYVDQFYPQVAIATLQLLSKLGVKASYPTGQTCCGQPMANAGFQHLTGKCNNLFYTTFKNFDYIVSPSGSCTLHIKSHLHLEDEQVDTSVITNKVFELTEFLIDVLEIKSLPAFFPHKVGLHQSCHGQRGLHLSQMSELVASPFSKPVQLLNMVKQLQMMPLSRTDECCGFGGTFCVSEEAVSVKMGKDRIHDHALAGVDYITANDMSCLMHLQGILQRQKSKLKAIHIVEILNAE